MPRNRSSLRFLALSLGLGCINALIFVFLVPPWQHYDEPKHFEYLWLLVHQEAVPEKGDFDPELSRAVITSMLAHGFWGSEDMSSLLERPAEHMTIPGYSQLDEPVAYYLWASLPLRWMKGASIESQLYAARLMSAVLFLLILVVGWATAMELTAPHSALRWMVPVSMALLPGFVDVMSAVNNDVAAVLGYSTFLWCSVRLLKRSFSFTNVLFCIFTAVACPFLKSTAAFALILLPLVMVLMIFRSQRPILVIVGVTGGLVAISLALIRWEDARYWHRATSQILPLRQRHPEAVLGEHVLALKLEARITPKWTSPVYQLLPEADWDQIANKRLTLGAWIWGTREVEVNFIAFVSPNSYQTMRIEVSPQPKFFAMHVDGPSQRSRVWLEIDPTREQDELTLYYDALVLAQGEYPINEPPYFESPLGESGVWSGKAFKNLVRNASFEVVGPRIYPWVDDFAAAYLPDEMRPSMALSALIDLPATAYLYRHTASHLFRTFWARFGWGHVPLYFFKFLGRRPYFYLGLVTLCALIGAAVAVVRRWRVWCWDIGYLLAIAMLIPWSITLMRGTVFLPLPHLYWSVARHAAVAIVPTIILLNAGWRELGWLIPHILRNYVGEIRFDLLQGVFYSFFGLLNVYAYFSIAKYYALIH